MNLNSTNFQILAQIICTILSPGWKTLNHDQRKPALNVQLWTEPKKVNMYIKYATVV